MDSSKAAPAYGLAPSRWDRPGVLLVLVLLFVAGTYSAAPLGDFVWDDVTLILEEPSIRELQPISAYFDRMFFGGPEGAPTRAFYRPLVTLSFAWDWKLWDGSPLGFHLSNVFLHLLCVALVFFLARKWGARPLAAAGGAALFGVLPRLTEAVAWISGRTDLLAAFFVLTALVIHRPRPAYRWAAALCLLMGLLSKEVAVAGFAALLLVELMGRESLPSFREPKAFSRLVPLVIVGLVYAALRVRVLPDVSVPTRAPDLGPWRRLSAAAEAIGSYTWMFLDPLRPRTQIGSIWIPNWMLVALGCVVLLLIVWLLATSRRRLRRQLAGQREGDGAARPAGGLPREPGLAAAALVVVPIALVSHLVPLPLQVVAADRFLYLPAAALAAVAASAVTSLGPKAFRASWMGAAVLVPVFASASYLRVGDWRDEITLWSEAIQHAPDGNSLPFVQLGIALTRAGMSEQALPHLDRAEAIDDRLHRERGVGDGMGSGALEAKALAFAASGRFDEAAAIFEDLAHARPYEPIYLYNLGVVWAMGLDFSRAEEGLVALLTSFPDYGEARRLLAEVRQNAERWESLPAIEDGEGAGIRLKRAEVLRAVGREGEAREIWLDVLESPSASDAERSAAAIHLRSGR